MKMAIIDLGSNSVRFDIYDVSPDGETERIHREKHMVRLGDEVFRTHYLKKDAIERTLEAFRGFKETLKRLEVDRTLVFATSAMRTANNAGGFIDMVREQTGLSIKIISGDREAKLIAKGILNNEETPDGVYLLIDIGGGSTEISICRKRSLIDSYSFELGANRLQQIFLKDSPPPLFAIDKLRRHIREVVSPHLVQRKWPNIDTVMGSSGTINAFRRIMKECGYKSQPFKATTLQKQLEKMILMDQQQLSSIPGMEAKRVDLIVAGGVLLDELLQIFNSKWIYTTEFNLRDGILESELEKLITSSYFQ